jgi:hypothetical protein
VTRWNVEKGGRYDAMAGQHRLSPTVVMTL